MNITGTNNNDIINGTSAADVINSGNGNDTINAGAGNDVVDAGNGDDIVNAGTGNDTVSGGGGNDTLDGGAGNDTLSGGTGDDILIYRASENVGATDVYDGGTGQDTLRLIVSQEMANSAAFQADLAALQAKLNKGAPFSFTSFNLRVTSIERVEVVIDTSGNHAPVAVADSVSTSEDTTLTILASALLANDTDADAGDTKTLFSVQGAQHGTVSVNASGNVVFAADANYSGVASFTYTIRDNAGATSTATVTVNVAAVADAPTLTVAPAAGNEDTAIALSIGAALTDTDGSEHLSSLTVGAIPAGAILSDGSHTFTADASHTSVDILGWNLSSLTVTPAANSDADFVLTVTATSQEGSSGPMATTTANLNVAVNAVADAPTLTVAPAAGNEDAAIALSINAALTDTDGSEHLSSLTVGAIPVGAILSDGGHTFTADASHTSVDILGWNLSSLTVTPAADSDADFVLTVTATSQEGSSGPTASTTVNLNVTVNPVADAPTITGEAISVVAPTEDIPLALHVALTDTDGSETIASVTISNVPSQFFVLTDGNQILAPNEQGDYVVSAAQVENLALHLVTQDLTGITPFTLSVTATSADGASHATSDVFALNVDISAGANEMDGRASDGYISGATVFADANNNGVWDPREATTVTAADGTFTLVNGSGPIVMSGGVDVSTGLDFIGTLRAPEGSTVVTPLTTLVAAIADASITNPDDPVEVAAAVAAALAAVAAAFGIPAGVDLTSFDPVPAAASGDADAINILAAAIQVQATIAQISAATGSTDVVDALANAIVQANGGTVDLTQTETLAAIITDAAPDADPAAIEAVSEVVAAANTAIDSAANGTGDPLAVLTSVAQAATVALGQTTDQLADAGLDTTELQSVVDNNTGEALTDAISQVVPGDPDGSQVGTIGADVLTGAGGNDIIDGLDGNDTLSGLSGNDTIYGRGGNDIVLGGDGNDTLEGGDGRDYLTGGAGDDHLDGGQSFDRAVYTDATGPVTINLAAGTASGAGVGTDTLINIEGAIGSNFADTFDATGFSGSSGLPGVAAGQSSFEGRGGDDVITGRINDLGQSVTRVEYLGASAAVTVDLAAGTGQGTAAGDVANVGHDTFTNALQGVFASAYNDTLYGSDNANFTYEVFEGRGGNDYIDGRGGYDIVTYNNDVTTTSGITVNLAAGTVIGDATVGTDTLRNVEAVRGTNFDDVFDTTGYGLAGALNVSTTNGNFNDIAGAGGNDTIIGNGNTRLNYSIALAAVTVDLQTTAGTAVTVAGSATGATEGTDTFTGVNAVQASSFSDTLLGSSFNNTFTGLGGDDYIDGRGGFDTASYNHLNTVTSGVTVNMAAGTATGDASIGTDTLRNIEGIQGTMLADSYSAVGYGAAGALNISTSNGNFNQFEGLGGDDTIAGNGNTRVLYNNSTAGVTITIGAGGVGSASGDASTGNDSFTGGVNAAIGSNFADTYNASAFNSGFFNSFQGNGGNDTITGNGSTQVQYSNATSGVTITIGAGGAGSASGDGSVGTDSFTGVNSAVGGNSADSYNASGFTGFNSFQGNGGNDTITGNGFTQIQYNNATGAVNVNLSTGTATGDGSVGTDSFTGVNSVAGSNFGDTLTGSSGNDVFFGNGGNDTLAGGGGADSLNGGGGADTFVYASGGGADFISDFNHGQVDRIDVTGVAGIFSLADIQARATQQGSNTLIDFGGGNTITLANITVGSLVASDFVFNNTVTGTSANDVLVGTSQVDGLFGLDGNDRLQGLAGNDTLDGGLGFDRAIYTDATGAITVNMAAGTVTGAGVGSDTLSGVEGVVGSDFADTSNATGFTGWSGLPGVQIGQNEFEGRGGDDVIIGIANVQGQALTRVNYLTASAAVTADIAAGTADGDASVGHDTFSHVYSIWGSAFNDTLYGSDTAYGTFELFEGRAGNDFIDGRGGYDRADYANDSTTTSGITVYLAAGTVVGDASVGTDTIRNVEAARGTNFDDVFDATGYGLAGALNVSTTNGNFNDFAGAGGNDTIIGNGNTRLNYALAAGSISVDLETSAIGTTNAITVAGSATGVGEGTDTFTGVNAAQGSTFADTLLGSSFNNTFTGLGGDDYIDGRGGFDTVSYNSVSTATGGVTVDFAAGTATGDASIGTDTLRNIEAVQGTNFADSFNAVGFGQAGALNVSTSNGNFNQFEGLAGNDTITGNGNTRLIYINAAAAVTVDIAAGTATGDASVGTDTFTGVNSATGSAFADTLSGSANNENFTGLAGNDVIDGRGGFDTAIYNAFNTTGGVSIDMASGIVTGDASVGTDTLLSIESVQGTNFADTYVATGFGTTGANVGSSGTFNWFQGNGGNDVITGNGNTQIQYASATGGVSVNLATGIATGDASVGTDTITGGVNNVFGSNFNDTIIGSSGNESLNGGSGNDTLAGGGGGDSLNGGAGADTFVYATGGGSDFVSDFTRGQGDRIDVTGVSGIFSLADIQAHASQQGSNTLIDFGNGDAIMLANITVGSLVASDFVFNNNSITGTPANDVLVGTSQIDGIFGLDGNDRLQGLAGNDTLDGGNGFDRAVYTDATGSITVNLTAGTATGAGVGTDTLVHIEGAVGSDFADTFDATGFAGISGLPGVTIGLNEFEGRGGDDHIIGNINALGQITTRISYLNATSAVTVDIAAGTADGDASVGHDTFTNVNAIFGSTFNDTLYGSDNGFATFEIYEGRGGDDYIDGRGGYDMVAYNNDPTTTSGIVVHLAAGTVNGDATVGTDTIRNVEAARGTVFDDVFDATGFGGVGAVNVGYAGTFNDFAGAGGNDTIIGNGNTRLNYSIALAAVTVDLETTAGTTITVAGSATGATEGTDSFTGVNAVQGSTFSDTLLGSSFNNTLTGLGGDDYIDGRGGFDTASYNSLGLGTGGVTVNLAAGTATGDASIGTDTLRNIEGVQGTGYADTFDATGYGVAGALNVSTSNGNFNQFEGLGGDDSITGNGNTRVLYNNATAGVTITIGAGGVGSASGDASTGNDSFTGGVNAAIGSNFADTYNASAFNSGYNSFQGNGGDDTIIGNGVTALQYGNATSGVTITISAGGTGTATGDASVGTDSFSGVNNVVGGNFADTYDASGFVGFNVFLGQGGNDTITGNGSTQIQYGTATGAVNVNLSTGTATGDGSVGTDSFTGVNSVAGSNFGDTILGGIGNDILFGNGGNDYLTGNGGNDNLTGGGGADTFAYFLIGGGADYITDFNHGQGDRIDVTGVAGIFSLADIQARATQQGSNTLIDFGGGNTITLANITVGSLVASDFVFNNSITGTSANDVLVGTSQIDGIFGLDGNDRLQGLAGNDTLDGGNGLDRAIYTDAAGSVTVNLVAGTASGAGVGTDTLVNIEGAVGSDFADTFDATGFLGSTALPGVAIGQNTFEGRGGDDLIIGDLNPLGQAVTRVEYLSASDAVTVDIAAGTGQGTAAGDIANVGHDTFSNVSTIFGSAFNDTIYGSDNASFTYETYEGRAGDDYIDGRGGYDSVNYNNDLTTTSGITVHLAAGTVVGDATVGTDTIRNVEAARGTAFDDVFDATGYGLAGALNVSTTNGSFNDFGGAGGNDTIIGNGNTRLNYQIALASVTVDLETTAGTAITVAGSATGATEGTDTFTGVNAVQGSMFGDTLLGSSFNNTITGLGGDDYIDGRGGFDTASYNSLSTVTSGVSVNMAAGTATGDASIGTDTLRNIEGIQGTMLSDTYDATGYGVVGALNVSTTNGNFNQFEGLGGDDTITGNGATRVLYNNATAGVTITIGAGGAGSAAGDASVGTDTFTGGVNAAIGSNSADSYDAHLFNNGFNSFQGNGGNDTITGNGSTQVQYSNATSGVTITIGAGGAGSASGDGSVGTDSFTGVNSAVGGNSADSYDASGFTGFNSFQGNGGNDTITGNGSTQIQYNNATGAVNVNLSTGTATGDGSVGTDTITGGVNNVLGSNFSDTLTGNAGNDFLNGNGGNDTINGGGGNDILTGGGGNDNFVFAAGSTVGATITDFTGNGASAGDTLEFHGFGLTTDGATLTFLSGNQWQVHSGLDLHDEIITINGSVHVSDYQFLA
ncbi:Ig-like domain-containing protein [Bradyrhizobium sp. AZCC 1693]|uniref:Ig-like domain-containing protein n=1 Tax=Bradyrhizobium sp. AZCC 1693 TaxID=3117029 RepID=UPI002FEE6BE8